MNVGQRDAIEQETIKKIIDFLNKRAEELYKLGGVHIRESVALGEAAMMLQQDMWQE
jgi:hypothetical protein